jgi:putative transposase
MPRRPQILLANHPLHIVQRGINREPWFFAGERRKGK